VIRRMFVFVCVLIVPASTSAQPPAPLPKEIAAAWEDARVHQGWTDTTPLGTVRLRESGPPQLGDLPAFWFFPWQEGVLAKLPDPGVPAQPPGPLPKDIVDAWRKQGAMVGWLRLNPRGYIEFIEKKDGAPGDLPCFRFYAPSSGPLPSLEKLPIPHGISDSISATITQRTFTPSSPANWITSACLTSATTI
jgi:hypothetical protein